MVEISVLYVGVTHHIDVSSYVFLTSIPFHKICNLLYPPILHLIQYHTVIQFFQYIFLVALFQHKLSLEWFWDIWISLLSWLAITPEEVNFISKRIIQLIMTLMHSAKRCSCTGILPWALIVRSYKWRLGCQ